MFRRIDGLAHGSDVARHAGRCFVVHHTHGLDRMAAVGLQPCFDQVGLHATAPARGRRQLVVLALVADDFRLQAEPRRHLDPQRCEVAGLVHQYLVAGRQHVAERRFPSPGARSRIDDHRMPGLENLPDAGQHLQPERGELRTAVVDGRQAHRPQDPVGHRRRSGDLQEMAAGGMKVEGQHGEWLQSNLAIFAYKIEMSRPAANEVWF